MLFLTLGSFVLFSIQWLCETLRYQRYGQIMRRLLRSASVLVQFTRKAHVGDLTRTSLLNVAKDAAETVQFEDDYIQISSLEPEQEIDLSSWTSYTSYLDIHNAVREPDQNICVLLEARRPQDLNKFVRKTMNVSPGYRVHVLQHGCPIAWKTAEPFGIILRCSFAGLVILSDAFGQGRLTLDEDLELIGLVTVKTKGHPQNLVANNEEILYVNDDPRESLDPPKGSQAVGGASQDVDRTKGNKGKQTSLSASISGEKQQRHRLEEGSNLDRSERDKQAISGASQRTLEEKSGNSKCSARREISSSVAGNGGESHTHSTKPPNILVYCGIKDTARKFTDVKSSLEACINTDAYTIYHLSHDSVQTVPWRENTALLVISSCANLRGEIEDEFAKYVLEDKGHLMSFNSSVDSVFTRRIQEEGCDGERLFSFKFKEVESVTSVRSKFCYDGTDDNTEVIVPQVQNGDISQQTKAMVVKIVCKGGGQAVLSQLLLERDPTEYARDQESFAALKRSNTERLAVLRDLLTSLGIDTSAGTIPSLTPCLLLTKDTTLKNTFLDSFKHRLKDDGVLKSQKMSLKFMDSDDETVASAAVLPVITNVSSDVRAQYFEPEIFWKNLKTVKLGRILFYCDVITSTMPVFDGLLFSIPENVGLIAIAGRQTSGRGRGGNAWLSPVGCAMFTLPVSIDVESILGQRLSFLQHIVSVAVVESVVSLPGYENLNVRLKWPNDIYYGQEMKLGGVLVTSTVMGSQCYATIGCGFNVSNSNPTICINDIIRLYNASHPELPDLSPLSTSQLLGRLVTILESLIETFQKKGYVTFCQSYYKYWLHSGAKVKVQLEDEAVEGEIVGLDEYGFLSIQAPDGKLLSVQPDGNSFDMMRNMIYFKTR